jgi:hypothetical protein
LLEGFAGLVQPSQVPKRVGLFVKTFGPHASQISISGMIDEQEAIQLAGALETRQRLGPLGAGAVNQTRFPQRLGQVLPVFERCCWAIELALVDLLSLRIAALQQYCFFCCNDMLGEWLFRFG